MNTLTWQGKVTDPLMNLRNCQALATLYGSNPTMYLRSALLGVIESNDEIGFRGLDAVCPPTAWCISGGSCAVWCAGTSGRIHVPQLLAGWNSVYDDWQTSYGASGAFYNAGRLLIDTIGPDALAGVNKYYLFGHSYGGACMQAMAAILRSAGNPDMRIWSYGSPRPGLFRLGTILSSATNTRFYADNDPVRFIPPHSSEVPSLTALDNWDLVRGCNTQVQCPNGWQLEADGRMVETEGNPTVLHAVAMSIIDWCMDLNGFRSVNHALGNYIARFQAAYTTLNPVVDVETSRPREVEEVLTIRQREQIVDVGIRDVNTVLHQEPNLNTDYVVPQLPRNSPLRFKRRKVGRIWGVKFGTDVVALGPGKRHAGKLARAFNRAARANW